MKCRVDDGDTPDVAGPIDDEIFDLISSLVVTLSLLVDVFLSMGGSVDKDALLLFERMNSVVGEVSLRASVMDLY